MTIDYLQMAIAQLCQLAKRQPSIPDYRFLLARCYLEIEPSRPKAIEILEQLVREFPDVPDYRYQLGESYAPRPFHGFRQRPPETSVLESGEAQLRKALEVTKDLERSHPNIPQYLMLNSRLHFQLARTLEDLSRQEEAVQHYQAAVDMKRLAIGHVSGRDRNPQLFWIISDEMILAELKYKLGQSDPILLDSIAVDLSELLRDPELQKNRFATEPVSRWCTRAAEMLCEAGKHELAAELTQKASELPESPPPPPRPRPPR